MAKLDINQEGINNPLEDIAMDVSYADQSIDYADLIGEDVFIGGTPYDTIIEGLTDQFNNYMKTTDATDYVDIFYDQMELSYRVIDDDEEEDHPIEKKEILDQMYDKFIAAIYDLIKVRLSLVIPDLEEGGNPDKDSIEYIIRKVYEVFILNARNTIKIAISADVMNKFINTSELSNLPDNQYFKRLNEILDDLYTPLLQMTPQEFLRYQHDDELLELFNDIDLINGNFLRRYTPKLYENEEFRVDLINYITMMENFKEDLRNGRQ